MQTPRIGILQFIPQVEDAVWGFISGLHKALGQEPAVDIQDAGGREERCRPLAAKLAVCGHDLLFGCLTPPALALKAATAETKTPVVFAPVFHPRLSGLVADEECPGEHVTGVSGRLDPQVRIEKMLLLFPRARETTVVADSADPLSLWDGEQLAEALAARGIAAGLARVDGGRPQPAAASRLHMLAFAPQLEETMEDWMPAFHAAAAPLAASSSRAGFLGAVMAVFADHGDLGRIAGEMAAEILQGADPGRMPVRHPESARIGFNYYAAGRLGISIPPLLAQSADIL